MKSIYLIKDISRMTGLSVFTTKYYIKRGLISEIGRSPETNFRYFDETTVASLERIKEYRKEGLSLEKIGQLLKSGKEGA